MIEAPSTLDGPGPPPQEVLPLSVRDLEVDYVNGHDRFSAVRRVSFDLPRAHKLAIVGESGCGKSTLALSVLHLIEPPGRIVGGDILVNGRSIMKMRERDLGELRGKEAALVFQDPSAALDPVKRIGKQVMEVIERHNPDLDRHQVRQRAKDVLLSVEMPSANAKFDAYPHELSGGLRQRVVIAIALANSPDVLIADEPTSALDVTTQAQIMDLLNRLVSEHGIAVALITHNLGLVAEFCDTVAVMYAGRFVEYADVDSIFSSPVHPYTEALLRCIPRPDALVKGLLPSLPGFPPNLAHLPAGCTFQPRCPLGRGDSLCRTVVPDAVRVATGAGPVVAECHYAVARADGQP